MALPGRAPVSSTTGSGRQVEGHYHRLQTRADHPARVKRARTLLISLLKTAPAQRRPSISWRRRHTEDLLAANFPAIWRDTNGQDQDEWGGKLSTANAPPQDGLCGRRLLRHQARAVLRADANFYDREVLARRCSARVFCLSQAIRRAIERAPPACARPAAAATTSATSITRSWVRRSRAMRAAARTTIAARIAFCRPLAFGNLRAEPVGSDEVTVFQAGPRRTNLWAGHPLGVSREACPGATLGFRSPRRNFPPSSCELWRHHVHAATPALARRRSAAARMSRAGTLPPISWTSSLPCTGKAR